MARERVLDSVYTSAINENLNRSVIFSGSNVMKSWVIVLFYSKFYSVAGCNLGWFPWGSLQWSPPWPRFKSHESCLLICMSFPESGSKDYRYTELLVIPLNKALKYLMYDFKRSKSILQLTSTVETTKYN